MSREFIVDDRQANSAQLKEEQCKARKLADYPLIRNMEGYLFFKGAIRFLYIGADYEEDWESFGVKAQNIKELIPEDRGERHTIKRLIPYIEKQSLCNIFSKNWVSNNDNDLRNILLYDNSFPYLHNFLLQNEKIETLSLLHQDIMDICEDAFRGRGYIQTGWKEECPYVWTDYERRQGYYRWTSFIIGNETHNRISVILDKSELFEIHKGQCDIKIHGHIQALFINFRYQQQSFTLYANNTICLMTENWDDKVSNPDNSEVYYISVENIMTEEQLIEQVETLITTYKDNLYMRKNNM